MTEQETPMHVAPTTAHLNGTAPSTTAAAPADTLPAAPLVYSRQELAAVLGLGLATVDRMDSAGKLPKPVRLGARKVWARAEIAEWLQAGAPDRRTWEGMRAARRR
jgi:predicted DNA-binding transcriptional regulator AlpA